MTGPMVQELENHEPELIGPPGDIEDEVSAIMSPKAAPEKPAPDKPEPEKPAPDKPEPEKPAPDKPEPAAQLTPEDVLGDDTPPPASEPPADLLPDSEVDSAFKGDVKARTAFIKERAFNKQLRDEVATLTSKIQELSAGAQDAAQLPELRGKIEEYEVKIKKLEDDIGRMDLTRSPEFRAKYIDPINSLAKRMVDALVTEGADQKESADFVRQVLSETKPSARERLIDDMAPGLKGTMLSFASRADELAAARSQALEQWRETSSAMQEADTRARLTVAKEKIEGAVSKAVASLQTLGSPYYMASDKPELQAALNSRVDTIKGVIAGGDMDQITALVAEGLTAPDTRRRFAAAKTRIAALEAQIQELTKGAPHFRGSPGGPAAPAPQPGGPAVSEQPIEDQAADFMLPPGARR